MLQISIESVYFVVAFFVPGAVFFWTVAVFVPEKTADPDHRIIFRHITISCVNYAIWSWVLFPFYKTGFLPEWIDVSYLWPVILLISPFVLGLLCGILAHNKIVAKVLLQLSVKSFDRIQTAWGYSFHKISDKSSYLIITLKTDEQLLGYFSDKSFAPNDQNDRDIYLEKLYTIDESGAWIDEERGIYISKDEIKLIEFLET